MSSFTNPHYLYVFGMKNGKKKFAYGETPDDAYENLRLRLTDKELSQVVKEDAIRINQRELRNYIQQLG